MNATMKRITKIVGVIRLSKPKKGKNKLETIQDAYGIEHQRSEIQRVADQEGAIIIAWYQEIESGTRKGLAKRLELAKAVQHARSAGAVLVIGKLDRLARNTHYISGLMESGCDFIICDNPHASKLTIHILAAVAEDEADRISARTKAGLEIARKHGVKLGSAREDHWKGREHLRGTKEACKASAQARTDRAIDAYKPIMPEIKQLQAQGKGFRMIARELNAKGYITTKGLPFSQTSVFRIVELFQREKVAV